MYNFVLIVFKINNMISKFKLTLLPILIFSLFSCSKKPIYQSHKEIQSAKRADATFNLSDSLSLSQDHAFLYKITNTGQDFSIRIKVMDESIQRKFLFTGLKVWVDTLARERKFASITYPSALKVGDKPRHPNGEKNFANDKKELVDNARLQMTEIDGFVGTIGFVTDIALDVNGNLNYLIVIPFEQLYGESWNLDRIATQPINICIENSKFEKPTRSDNDDLNIGIGGIEGGYGGEQGGIYDRGEGYGGSRGGGRMGGGMRHGREGGYRSKGSQESSKEIKECIRVLLSKN
jgi:hypothetical protein